MLGLIWGKEGRKVGNCLGTSDFDEFSTEKETYTVGEPVVANLRIKNVGDQPLGFMKGGRNRAARDCQYRFSGFLNGLSPLVDIGDYYHEGGLAFPVLLEPGEVFEDQIDFAKWFEFSEAGHYELHGSYYMRFIKPSNPGDWELLTIWEDYVSSDFGFSMIEEAD
ncbi:MAG: hypothetical protein ACSHYA_19565 [Opitutaceae bacterium]